MEHSRLRFTLATTVIGILAVNPIAAIASEESDELQRCKQSKRRC